LEILSLKKENARAKPTADRSQSTLAAIDSDSPNGALPYRAMYTWC